MRNVLTAAVATALIASGCGTGRLEIDHKKAENLARQIGATGWLPGCRLTRSKSIPFSSSIARAAWEGCEIAIP